MGNSRVAIVSKDRSEARLSPGHSRLIFEIPVPFTNRQFLKSIILNLIKKLHSNNYRGITNTSLPYALS